MIVFVVDDLLFKASVFKPTIISAQLALMPESTIQNIGGDIYLWPNVRPGMKHPRHVIGVLAQVDELHTRRVEQLYGYIPFDFDNSRRIPVQVNVKRLYAKNFDTFAGNRWHVDEQLESATAYVGNPGNRWLRPIEIQRRRRVTYPLSKQLFDWLRDNDENVFYEKGGTQT